MCGKFTQYASWSEVHAFSQPLVGDELVASTPMRFANIMRLNAQGEREMVPMRWGFAAKGDTSPARPKHMHARAETIDKLPTFRNAFEHQRGILLVHTFNEGEELSNGKTKQWVITPLDSKPIAIAVIYEEWQNGPEKLLTFILVTTSANLLISRITDRMPAILQPEDWSLWLGEREAPLSEVKAVLRTYEDAGTWTMTEQVPTKRSSSGQSSMF
jgi:putative SOS response-associated peptidase YedK